AVAIPRVGVVFLGGGPLLMLSGAVCGIPVRRAVGRVAPHYTACAVAPLPGAAKRAGESRAASMASLCCSILQLTHVECFDRSVEALEDEFAYCFQLRQRFDLGVHFCIDQNLAIERLGPRAPLDQPVW